MSHAIPPIPTRPSPAPAVSAMSVWLTVEDIRKQGRMRRERVLEAMNAGELPFEQRGRIRYARLSDVLAWEERRLTYGPTGLSTRNIAPELAELAYTPRTR